MSVQQLGALKLTRVEYMALSLPPELLGLTSESVAQLSWAIEPWVTDGQINVAAAAWFLEVDGKTAVIDPVQALDVVLRADSEAEQHHQRELTTLFAKSGFDVSTIDFVLMTHIEDVGAVAKYDSGKWQPFFPNAKILLSETQLVEFTQDYEASGDLSPQSDAWRAMIDQQMIETYQDSQEILPGVVAEVTNKHQQGHSVFHLNDNEATFIGHLAVTPVHVGSGPCSDLNREPALAYECLHQIAKDQRALIAPLWPSPGVATWRNDELTLGDR